MRNKKICIILFTLILILIFPSCMRLDTTEPEYEKLIYTREQVEQVCALPNYGNKDDDFLYIALQYAYLDDSFVEIAGKDYSVTNFDIIYGDTKTNTNNTTTELGIEVSNGCYRYWIEMSKTSENKWKVDSASFDESFTNRYPVEEETVENDYNPYSRATVAIDTKMDDFEYGIAAHTLVALNFAYSDDEFNELAGEDFDVESIIEKNYKIQMIDLRYVFSGEAELGLVFDKGTQIYWIKLSKPYFKPWQVDSTYVQDYAEYINNE